MKYKLTEKDRVRWNEGRGNEYYRLALVEDIFGRTYIVLMPNAATPSIPEKESSTLAEISDFLKGQASLLAHHILRGNNEAAQRAVESMDRIVCNYAGTEYKTLKNLAIDLGFKF